MEGGRSICSADPSCLSQVTRYLSVSSRALTITIQPLALLHGVVRKHSCRGRFPVATADQPVGPGRPSCLVLPRFLSALIRPHDASTTLGLQQLRRWLPLELRQRVLAVKRHLNDRRQAVRWSEPVRWSEALGRSDAFGWIEAGNGGEVVALLEQPVLPGELLANKLENLQLAIAQLNGTLLPPGHTWSFWRLVGRPGRRRGYRLGRNLVDGRLVPQRGGGLCQLAGLVYHLGLLAGVEVVERHAHSVDLYSDDHRFTPLGADAAVVWGVKDLRLVNPHPVPLRLGCQLAGQRLLGRLEAPRPLRPREVRFEALEQGANQVRVHDCRRRHRAPEQQLPPESTGPSDDPEKLTLAAQLPAERW